MGPVDLESFAFARDDSPADPDAISVVGLGTHRDSYRYQYWRKPDGWICIAPAWPTEYQNYSEMGYQALKQYGQFLMNTNTDGWRPSQEPWRRIFQRGGQHEFPLAQVLEHGWHRVPPYKGVIFPQLAGVEQVDAICPHCAKAFLTVAHLAKHESVMHRETSQQEVLARALSKAQSDNPSNAAIVGALQALAAALGQQGQVLAAVMERVGMPTAPAAVGGAATPSTSSPESTKAKGGK